MRQLKYSEYKFASKLLFVELNVYPEIEFIRGIIEQVDPSARVEYLGYDELRDKYLYIIIIMDDSYVCENRIVAYEILHPD